MSDDVTHFVLRCGLCGTIEAETFFTGDTRKVVLQHQCLVQNWWDQKG